MLAIDFEFLIEFNFLSLDFTTSSALLLSIFDFTLVSLGSYIFQTIEFDIFYLDFKIFYNTF